MKGKGAAFIRGILIGRNITHQQIAGELGMSRSSVSTMLGRPDDQVDVLDAYRIGEAVGSIRTKRHYAARRSQTGQLMVHA